MKTMNVVTFVVVVLALLLAPNAYALPTLQLGIDGGYYDRATETTMSLSPVFSLRAYLNANSANMLSDTYYISAALVPRPNDGPSINEVGNFGSFTFGEMTINVTSDMVYGTPPLDALYPDLGPHGIFETYYREISFQFSGATTAAVDTRTMAVQPGTLYYADFMVDTTALTAGYDIHFDLYNENLGITKRREADYRTEFAPFSHDAQSNGHQVTEASSLVLLGAGLVGLEVFRHKIHKT